jgi:MFS family permease
MVPFAILGLVFASYFVRTPSLKLAFGLSDGRLGLLLTLPVLTGLAAMQLTGPLIARLGSATVVRATMVALPGSLLGLALAPDVGLLAAALLLLGAFDGLFDVSMNAHAVTVERAVGIRILNRCHAALSIGAVVGSLLGGAAIRAGLSLDRHFGIVAAVAVSSSMVAGRFMLPAALDRRVGTLGTGPVTAPPANTSTGSSTDAGRGDRFAGWTARVLVLGVTGAVVLITEGAVGSWSGILLHDERGASLAAASLGYIGFSMCQAGGRLVGDRLHERLGARVLVGGGGALALAGLSVVVLSAVPAVAVAGFALLGLGLSVVLPVIFSVVGHGGADAERSGAASALAKVNTLTYGALLAGPALVGRSADAVGLTATMGGLLGLLAVTLVVGVRQL